MEDSTAPAGEVSAPEGSEAPVAAPEAIPASAGDGNAPVAGDDAQVGEIAAEPVTPAEFQFANRKFPTRERAEEIIRSEIGRTRGLQKQAAEQQKQIEQLQAVIASFQGQQPKGNGQGQVPKEEGSYAERLAKSGDLEFIADRALRKNGQTGQYEVTKEGFMEAMFALAQDIDKHHSESLEKAIGGVQSTITQSEQHRQQEATVARAFTAASSLVKEFPELDDNNKAEGIEEVQADILALLQSGPPVTLESGNVVPLRALWLATEPKEALRWAAETYRRTNGTPVFAQPPGTSGSPSAKVASAAERAAAATTATPLDGSGVPRQGHREPKTLEDRWRRESAQLPKEATTPSGRKLGFSDLP